MQSDEVVAAGLRLLWQFDAFLAEVDANRLDEVSKADRDSLYDAFVAAAAAMTTARHRVKLTQKETVRLTGTN